MTIDLAALGAELTSITNLVYKVLKLYEDKSSGRYLACLNYIGSALDEEIYDKTSIFISPVSELTLASAHARLKEAELKGQMMACLERCADLIRAVPALDHDHLHFFMRLYRRSKNEPRVDLAVMNQRGSTRSSDYPLLSETLAQLDERVSRVAHLPKPGSRKFLVDDTTEVLANTATDALRLFATFERPRLFDADYQARLSGIRIAEICDSTLPLKALLD